MDMNGIIRGGLITQKLRRAEIVVYNGEVHSNKGVFLEKMIVGILLSVFFLPILAATLQEASVGLWENIFLSFVSYSAFVLTLVLWFMRGAIFAPTQTIFLSLCAIAGISLLSSLKSGVFWVSFFGGGAGERTALEIIVLVALTILIALFLRTKQRILSALSLLFVSAFIALSFQMLSAFVKGSETGNVIAKPSVSETFAVFRGTLSEGFSTALLGAGPNRFGKQWAKHHSLAANMLPAWDMDLQNGAATPPTIFVETGILGLLGWAVFLLIFILLGWRTIRFPSRRTSKEGRRLSLLLFFGALCLWGASLASNAGAVLFALAFLLTGLFVGSLFAGNSMKFSEYALFVGRRRMSVVALFGVIFACLLFGGYKLFLGYRSVLAYREGVIAVKEERTDAAEERFTRAISLMRSDAYYRDFSLLEIYRLRQLLERENIPPDVLRAEFEKLFRSAVEKAKKAIQEDPENYINHIAYGNVLAFVIPFDITGLSEDAYKGARSAYEKAASLSPSDPRIFSGLAQISLAKGDTDSARISLKKSLELKKDFRESSALLAELEFRAGNIKSALEVLEKAVLENQSDPALLFQLGFLYYHKSDYERALSVLEKAVFLQPDYSNAKYFLGLSYYRLGRTFDAVRQIQDVARLNPDNAEVARVLRDLEAGRSPVDKIHSLGAEGFGVGQAVTTTPPLILPPME
ncbi:MAG: tetratricopeptide repeat protein [Parcubacteria group bacterium]|nr:tetratricopeptide repeat protein [Parcubacteria group bacterium]